MHRLLQHWYHLYITPFFSHPLIFLQDELELLNHTALDSGGRNDHELRTAPVLTRGAYLAAGFFERSTQYGVLGSVLGV